MKKKRQTGDLCIAALTHTYTFSKLLIWFYFNFQFVKDLGVKTSWIVSVVWFCCCCGCFSLSRWMYITRVMHVFVSLCMILFFRFIYSFCSDSFIARGKKCIYSRARCSHTTSKRVPTDRIYCGNILHIYLLAQKWLTTIYSLCTYKCMANEKSSLFFFLRFICR